MNKASWPLSTAVRPSTSHNLRTYALSRGASTISSAVVRKKRLGKPISFEGHIRHHRGQLFAPQGISPSDEVNPPLRTLPPPLNLPTWNRKDLRVIHLFRTGRAYGSFYWAGLKAAWSNNKASAPLRDGFKRMHEENPASRGESDVSKNGQGRMIGETLKAVALQGRALSASRRFRFDASRELQRAVPQLTRARFQTLVRNERDFRKLPQFGVLVAICGEYLPLLVPFMPSLVPRTCQIPKQIDGMRQAVEERRAASFTRPAKQRRMDAEQLWALEPQTNSPEERMSTEGALKNATGMNPFPIRIILKEASYDVLHHYSVSLGLHARLWDRLSMKPPRWLLERRLRKHFWYLYADDVLLLDSSEGVQALSDEEVKIACEERAVDVTGRSVSDLRSDLQTWLELVDGAFQKDRLLAYRIDRALSMPCSSWGEFRAIVEAAPEDKVAGYL